MAHWIRVDFHLHSDRSDGYFSPEALARKVAAAGVHFAALTDHERVDGWEQFREAFEREGGIAISGVEILTRFRGREVHLLGYGFDPGHADIKALLKSEPALDAAVEGIHRAGGVAFVAHPLTTWPHIEDLEEALPALQQTGIDGIETHHSSYPKKVRARLSDLAGRHGLLRSAGSDHHGPSDDTSGALGADIEDDLWKAFRGALPAFRNVGNSSSEAAREVRPSFGVRMHWRLFLLHILLPTLLATGLFVAALFAIILPSFENNLMGRKREMIRELTNSAWSILADYSREAQQGQMSLGEAQRSAVDRIRHLRYGNEGKDYFWITDMKPRMVMHPYRSDLDGQDLTEYRDPRGVPLFVEFVKTVRRSGHGYLEYVWQWKDDPARLAPKESYVRGFQPWGWIIGTGIYVEDVRAEIEAIERRLVSLCIGISAIIALLLTYVLLQSLRIERERGRAEHDLHESREKYRALVEASTEGTLMLVGRRCAYANQKMLRMSGYSEAELPFLDIYELFPPQSSPDGEQARFADDVLQGAQALEQREAKMRRKDGSLTDVLLTVTRIEASGKPGLIIVAKEMRRAARLEGTSAANVALAESTSLGVIRASAGGSWTVIEANPAARAMIGEGDADRRVNLQEVFESRDERAQFFDALLKEGRVQNMRLRLRGVDGRVSSAVVCAALVRGDDGQPRFCDAVIEDVTGRQKAETEREELITQLQTSLLFLNQPASASMTPLTTCPISTTIARAAQLMSRDDSGAIAVTTAEGAIAGIVTDHDLRRRALAVSLDPSRSVMEIMTAPVVSIPASALVYEALLRMRERQIGHLVVQDSGGRSIGMLRSQDLVRFDHYSAAVLTQDIRSAGSPEEVQKARAKLPALVSSLVASGARPRGVARAVTSVSDSAVERLLALAISDLGEPPAPFAFLALGSEGREEQTLVTDQDNALVFADCAGKEGSDYFLKLGKRVCSDLAVAGYAECKGDAMASNPRWNQPLSQWKDLFEHWIREPNPEELFHFSIFFDIRPVGGDRDLARQLIEHVRQTVREEPPFFFHLARNALHYKPPIGMFGQILTGPSGDVARAVNLKDASMPIVHFARLYSLRQEVSETNTEARIQALGEAGVLHPDDCRELLQAYEFLLLLRYKNQAEALGRGEAPTNLVDPGRLTHLEASTLKLAFSQVATVQKKILFDYPGTAG